jgi:hypothetical protein
VKDWHYTAIMVSFVVFCLLLIVLGIVMIVTDQSSTAIEVFSARFDECMATEQFTREECIAYADEGE